MEFSSLHLACLILAQAAGAGDFNPPSGFQLQPSPTLRAPLDPTDRGQGESSLTTGPLVTSPAATRPTAVDRGESALEQPGRNALRSRSELERNAFEPTDGGRQSSESLSEGTIPRERELNGNRFSSPLVEPSRGPLGGALQPSSNPRGAVRLTAPAGMQGGADQTRPRDEAAVVPAAVTEEALGQATALVQQAVAYDDPRAEAEPLSLLQAVTRADAFGMRREVVEAYWKLTAAVGERFFCREEVQLLSDLSVESAFDGKLLSAARSQSLARQAAAELQLVSAQERLAELAGLEGERLPLPTELPFVGRYETRLANWLENSSVPRRLRQLDREFPLRLTLIERRAEAVVDFEAQLGEVLQAYQQRQVALPMVLDTIGELAVQRRSFLSEVVTYNQAIAEYSNSIVSNALPTRTYVATLIRLPAASAGSPTNRDPSIMPVSNQIPLTTDTTFSRPRSASTAGEWSSPVSALRAVRQ